MYMECLLPQVVHFEESDPVTVWFCEYPASLILVLSLVPPTATILPHDVASPPSSQPLPTRTAYRNTHTTYLCTCSWVCFLSYFLLSGHYAKNMYFHVHTAPNTSTHINTDLLARHYMWLVCSLFHILEFSNVSTIHFIEEQQIE